MGRIVAVRWFGKYLDLVSVAVKVSFSASLVASGLLLLKVPFEQLALKGNRSLLSKPDKYLCESMLACTIPTFVEQMFAGSFPLLCPGMLINIHTGSPIHVSALFCINTDIPQWS